MHFAVLHIPHSSTRIPDAVRRSFRISDAALARELLHLTDHFTDELYAAAAPGLAEPAVYGASRLVVDPERFADDTLEPMSKHGLGAIYTRTLTGERLRPEPSPDEREALLDAFYRPHHERVAALVEQALCAHGCALVLDGHSYPSRPHPFEDPVRPRPEICLGTDRFHTPEWLFDAAARLFAEAGFSVERDHPFAGALVPSSYYAREPAVLAIMIELRRGTYLDEESGAKLAAFDGVRVRLQRAVAALTRTAKERT